MCDKYYIQSIIINIYIKKNKIIYSIIIIINNADDIQWRYSMNGYKDNK